MYAPDPDLMGLLCQLVFVRRAGIHKEKFAPV